LAISANKKRAARHPTVFTENAYLFPPLFEAFDVEGRHNLNQR
jgi:hypothetical protein